MQEKNYKTVDKSRWPRGAWDSEPDKLQFSDPATGLPCLIVRAHSGSLCGYVGVVEGHPAFGKDYEKVDVDVHGGLTYSGFCQHTSDERTGVCHVPGTGDPEQVWWLGFDCAHYGDLPPAYSYFEGVVRTPDEEYRDVDYVRRQCAQLANQLSGMPKGRG